MNDRRSERSEIRGSGPGRPWDERLDRVDDRRRQNRTGERRLGLPPVRRGADDAERSPAQPDAASLVAEHRPPPAAPRQHASRPAAERHRSGARDEQHAGPLAERVLERNRRVRVHHDFVGHIARDQRLPERVPLRRSPASGHANDRDGRHGVDFGLGQRLANCPGDDVGRAFDLSGLDGAGAGIEAPDLGALGVRDQYTGLGPTPIDADDDLIHE